MNNKEFKASEILGIKDPSTILNYVRDWSSNLSEKEHIIKSVVQEIHQNCETRLDRIIYKLLTYCTPKGTTDTEIEKTEEDMWKEIGKMGFEQKYRLLKPILQNWTILQNFHSVLSLRQVQDQHLKLQKQIQIKQ